MVMKWYWYKIWSEDFELFKKEEDLTEKTWPAFSHRRSSVVHVLKREYKMGFS